MNIGQAVELLLDGQRVRRAGWNGQGLWLALQEPEGPGSGLMTVPFVFMSTVQGELVPWLCSQTDLLADDWERA